MKNIGKDTNGTNKNKKSNAWKDQDEVDNLRIETEKKAFDNLIVEIEKMWKGVVEEYAKK